MTKKKVWKSRSWTKKDYYNLAKNAVDEKILEFLVIKILGSKTLSLKDAREFLRLYLKHLSREFYSYDELKEKDKAMTVVIKETYNRTN